MVAQSHLCLYLVAVGDSHIVHLVSETQDAHVVGVSPCCCHSCPYSNLLLRALVFPIAADDLARTAQTGTDMSELAVAVSTLVQVHEVHVHRVPRNLGIILGMEMQQRFLQLLQTVNPHLRR